MDDSPGRLGVSGKNPYEPAKPGDLWTLEDVAAYLKLKKAIVYKMLRERRIPAHKFVGRWRFYKPEIEKWTAEHAVASAEDSEKPEDSTTLRVRWGKSLLHFKRVGDDKSLFCRRVTFECSQPPWLFVLRFQEKDDEDPKDSDVWFFEAGRKGEEDGHEIWVAEVEDINPQSTPQQSADQQRRYLLELLGLNEA